MNGKPLPFTVNLSGVEANAKKRGLSVEDYLTKFDFNDSPLSFQQGSGGGVMEDIIIHATKHKANYLLIGLALLAVVLIVSLTKQK